MGFDYFLGLFDRVRERSMAALFSCLVAVGCLKSSAAMNAEVQQSLAAASVCGEPQSPSSSAVGLYGADLAAMQLFAALTRRLWMDDVADLDPQRLLSAEYQLNRIPVGSSCQVIEDHAVHEHWTYTVVPSLPFPAHWGVHAPLDLSAVATALLDAADDRATGRHSSTARTGPSSSISRSWKGEDLPLHWLAGPSLECAVLEPTSAVERQAPPVPRAPRPKKRKQPTTAAATATAVDHTVDGLEDCGEDNGHGNGDGKDKDKDRGEEVEVEVEDEDWSERDSAFDMESSTDIDGDGDGDRGAAMDDEWTKEQVRWRDSISFHGKVT